MRMIEEEALVGRRDICRDRGSVPVRGAVGGGLGC
jgi:hypothetical protein